MRCKEGLRLKKRLRKGKLGQGTEKETLGVGWGDLIYLKV